MKLGYRIALSVVTLSVAGAFVSHYGSQPYTEIFRLAGFPFTGRGVAVMIAFVAIIDNIILHVVARMYARPLASAVPKIEPPRQAVVTLNLRHADPVDEFDGCESIPPGIVADCDPEDEFIENALACEALERARAAEEGVEFDPCARAEFRRALEAARVASRQDDVMTHVGPYGSTADRPSLEEQLDALVSDCSIRGESKSNESGEHEIGSAARLAAMIQDALTQNGSGSIRPMRIIPISGNTAPANSAAA